MTTYKLCEIGFFIYMPSDIGRHCRYIPTNGGVNRLQLPDTVELSMPDRKIVNFNSYLI